MLLRPSYHNLTLYATTHPSITFVESLGNDNWVLTTTCMPESDFEFVSYKVHAKTERCAHLMAGYKSAHPRGDRFNPNHPLYDLYRKAVNAPFAHMDSARIFHWHPNWLWEKGTLPCINNHRGQFPIEAIVFTAWPTISFKHDSRSVHYPLRSPTWRRRDLYESVAVGIASQSIGQRGVASIIVSYLKEHALGINEFVHVVHKNYGFPERMRFSFTSESEAEHPVIRVRLGY